MLLQGIIGGLVLGSTYTLVASGLTLILGVTRIVNFAHGEFFMLGGYCFWLFLVPLGLPTPLAMILAVLVSGGFGMLCEWGFFRYARSNFLAAVGGSVGIGLILTGAVLLLFGQDNLKIPSFFSGGIEIAGGQFTWERLWVILISLLSMGALYWIVEKTRTGRAMRAVSRDAEVSSLQGINVNSTYLIAMGLGSAMAGLAGVILAPIAYIAPSMGVAMLSKALLIMIIGGLGSMTGAVIAGMAWGLFESIGMIYIGGMVDLIGFAIVLVLLIFRPGGLLGEVWEI